MKVTLDDLRHHAIATSLFPATSLRRAIARLGFVQADPIRSPARAQDLILRHRVIDYRAGDLDRNYVSLDLEEDFLYAYGFMPQSTWRLLHPRGQRRLSKVEQRILDIVSQSKRLHPRELESELGKRREINAWGGYSKATTHSLQRLHYLGLIRIVGRENGVRVYGRTVAAHEPHDPAERLRRLVLTIAKLLAPAPESSLQATLRHLGRAAPHLTGRIGAVKRLLQAGDLQSAEVEGVRYVWPTARLVRQQPEDAVRFLAPFDPLVWDRQRFELFWKWPYRFEAYTPPPKRKLGYYAMPMLWRADVVGWVNISVRAGKMIVDPGFTKPEIPVEKEFQSAFDAECGRFELFLSNR
ncbi:MAG: DNA glycosylase AlkZ-like family protein [Terriglobales bacterium]